MSYVRIKLLYVHDRVLLKVDENVAFLFFSIRDNVAN